MTTDEIKDKDLKTCSDTELNTFMASLMKEHIPNDMVRHRAIVQALAIINEKNNREYKKLDKRNIFLTVVVIVLTITQVIIGILQLCNS